MRKDIIFLGESGLTSTSANHIANLAKEYIQNTEYTLGHIEFYNGKVTIIGSSNYNVVNTGDNSNTLVDIPGMLDSIASAKSLIAWLREGIKAKDNLLREVKNLDLRQYCRMKDFVCPEEPELEDCLTEDEYMASLSIKERNRIYMLQTKCAVLGQAIHPSGYLSTARKELLDKIQHPHTISGQGRDALLYTYEPTVSTEEVENLFFKLQSEHRSYQAELNGLLHKMSDALTLDEQTKRAAYNEKLEQYSSKRLALSAEMKSYIVAETKRLQELKIVIPNELKDVYNAISELGKN